MRFIRPEADERKLTRVSRLASVGVLVLGTLASWLMRDIAVDEAWRLLAAMGAGTGAVFMLRWFWWRINAWSEISAMVASLVYFLILGQYVESSERRLAIVALLTIVTWLVATFLTRPESEATLEAFYAKIRPGGSGWGPIARNRPEVEVDSHLPSSALAAVLATALVYFTLPAVGYFLFGETAKASACALGALAAGASAYALVRRVGWERVVR